MQNLPNGWIHHNAYAIFGKDYSELTKEQQEEANGWLDYSEWTPPPYRDHYANNDLKFDKPFVVVSNRYNFEHGKPPLGFLDIECLYKIFNYLTDKGYKVI